MVKLIAPKDCGGAAVDGTSYTVANGMIDANQSHVKELLTNGFTLPPEELKVNWEALQNGDSQTASFVQPDNEDPNVLPPIQDASWLNRTQLFNWLRLRGVIVQVPQTRESLMKIALEVQQKEQDAITSELKAINEKNSAEKATQDALSPSSQASLQVDPATPAVSQNSPQSGDPATGSSGEAAPNA